MDFFILRHDGYGNNLIAVGLEDLQIFFFVGDRHRSIFVVKAVAHVPDGQIILIIFQRQMRNGTNFAVGLYFVGRYADHTGSIAFGRQLIKAVFAEILFQDHLQTAAQEQTLLHGIIGDFNFFRKHLALYRPGAFEAQTFQIRVLRDHSY